MLDSFPFGKNLVESYRLRGRKETVAVECEQEILVSQIASHNKAEVGD